MNSKDVSSPHFARWDGSESASTRVGLVCLDDRVDEDQRHFRLSLNQISQVVRQSLCFVLALAVYMNPGQCPGLFPTITLQ